MRYFLTLLLLILSLTMMQAKNYSKIEVEENLRLGVNAFHFGYYQQAIVMLEKSLAFLDQNSEKEYRQRLLLWLGRVYYHNGDTSQALESWRTLIEQGEGSSTLQAIYEIVDSRYSQGSDNKNSQLALFERIEPNAKRQFKRPSAIHQSPFNSLRYLVDFADNSILLLDVNGNTIQRLTGSLTIPYSQPYDLLFNPKGGFIVSDYASNKLLFHNDAGQIVGSFGAEQGLLGPQYLSSSNDGYFYVSDWGRHRLTKFDFSGNTIFSFGDRPNGKFPGLISPTGIAANAELLLVADASKHAIYSFDHDGNYRSTMLEGRLNSPEGLLFNEGGQLLIADQEQIKKYDLQSRQLSVIYQGEIKSKYYNISYDRNDNLMASDFKNQRIDLLISEPELYSNLFVDVDRIYSENFPQVELLLRVESRNGRAIKDLTRSNFLLFENNQPIPNPSFIHLKNNTRLNLVVAGKLEQLAEVIQELEMQMQASDKLDVVIDRLPLQVLDSQKIKLLPSTVAAAEPELSRTIRMAADALLRTHSGWRILLYLIPVNKRNQEFSSYGLAEIMQLLKNNGIILFALGTKPPSEEINYLLSNSMGKFINTNQPKALTQQLKQQRQEADNLYHIAYNSPRENLLHNSYINTAIIVNYGSRSGRHEIGYFPPA